MSNQRNADKDREIIAADKELGVHHDWTSHWLERAVSAEQRVTELTDNLRWTLSALTRYTAGEPVPNLDEIIAGATKALKGGTETI